jgi:hypothetical protein
VIASNVSAGNKAPDAQVSFTDHVKHVRRGEM